MVGLGAGCGLRAGEPAAARQGQGEGSQVGAWERVAHATGEENRKDFEWSVGAWVLGGSSCMGALPPAESLNLVGVHISNIRTYCMALVYSSQLSYAMASL